MELNELLDGLINKELADVSLYKGEAGLFADKVVGGERIAEVFSRFAREEAEHAGALMAIAGRKSGSPARTIAAGSSLRNSLEMHANRETTGITIYRRLADMLSAPEHKLIVKGIIAQEIEHLRAAQHYLRALNGGI